MKTGYLESEIESVSYLNKMADIYFSGDEFLKFKLAPYYKINNKDKKEVTNFICLMFDVNYIDFINVKGKSRTKAAHNTFKNKHGQVLALLSYVYRNYFRVTLPKIALDLNLKSHRSVLWAISNCENWYTFEPSFKKIVDACFNCIDKDLLPFKESLSRKNRMPYIKCVNDDKTFTYLYEAAKHYSMSIETIQKSLRENKYVGRYVKRKFEIIKYES